MPERCIELCWPARGLVAEAVLLDAEAPRTCQALWERLPIEAETIHALVSGCELYVLFPWDGPPPPRENQTVCVDAGDLFFYFAPWYAAEVASGGEIAIYYDRDAIPTGGAGLMAGALVARLSDPERRQAVADACEEIWRMGSERLVIRRGREEA